MERNILCRELGIENENTALKDFRESTTENFWKPFWTTGSPTTSSPVLLPVKTEEETATGYTCYVKIDLNLKSKSDLCYTGYFKEDAITKAKQFICTGWVDDPIEKKTAVFAPSHFTTALPVDLIVYLHGHLGGHPGIKPKKPVHSPCIKEYLNYAAKPYFNIRELIEASGKNVIFAAPTLGPRSQYGNLAKSFDAYMDQVIAVINEYIIRQRKLNGVFKLGRLIIAAHSGGGSAMLAITGSAGRYSKLINECWGFDSWYNSSTAWDTIAKRSPHLKIFGYYYNSGNIPNKPTHNGKRNLVKNFCTVWVGKDVSSPDHFTLLPHYFKERLNDVACKTLPVKDKEVNFLNERNLLENEFEMLMDGDRYHPGFETSAYGYENNEWYDQEVADPLKTDSPFHYSKFGQDKKDTAFFDFKKRVYTTHVRWAASAGKEFVSDQPDGMLTTWKNKDDLTYTEENGKRKYKQATVHARMEEPLRQLLQALKSDAKNEGKDMGIYISNGYRSATTQFNSWDSHFKKYYERAINEAGLSRGDYSDVAVDKLTTFIRAKLGAPGYSNHQHGRAVDFFLQELNEQTGRKENFPVDTGSTKINGKRILHADRWRTTWTWNWLNKNAARFGFCPYEKEPWHWEYWKDVDPDLKKCRQKTAFKNKKEEQVFAPANKATVLSSTKTPAASTLPTNSQYDLRKIKRTKKGYSAYGGGKLKTKLESLRSQGKLNMTDNEIELLQELARTESSGLVQAINSWDSAYMSMGFAQFTFIHKHHFPYRKIMQVADTNDLKRIEKNSPLAFNLYFNKSAEPGKLQMMIQLAPDAFKKYGIELADQNIKWKDRKGNVQEVQSLKGLNTLSELRSYDWAKRFYVAGLDDEIIIAQAKLTLYVLEMSLYTMQIKIGNSYFISYYKSSPALRGLIQEAYNNRPAYLTGALKITSQLLLPKGKVSAQDFITLLKQEIVKQYDQKENDKAKGLRLTGKY